MRLLCIDNNCNDVGVFEQGFCNVGTIAMASNPSCKIHGLHMVGDKSSHGSGPYSALLSSSAHLRFAFGPARTRQHLIRRFLPFTAMAAASTTTSSLPDAAEKVTAPYGSWKSPITADVVSSSCKKLRGMAVAGDGQLVWIETRPDEGGLVEEGLPFDLL
ncbi:hypothetical protein ZIOFF_041917 [Zingiber officinale]|uniref:Uncharacterized protein n=1 Tax=Zingiber officinale TaxID=94328 RepID=A0A8J5L6B9_ZINOF|nr:hypothetical protein ZIOFF_041917 [Zingiber officinale]